MKHIERDIRRLTDKLADGLVRLFTAELARRASLVKFAAAAARENEITRQLADLEEQPDAATTDQADSGSVPDVQGEDQRAVPRDGAAEPPAAPVAHDEAIGGESVDAAADDEELGKRPRRRSHTRPRAIDQVPVLTTSERAAPIDDDEEDLPAPAKRDRFAAIQASAAKRTGVLPKSRTTVTL